MYELLSERINENSNGDLSPVSSKKHRFDLLNINPLSKWLYKLSGGQKLRIIPRFYLDIDPKVLSASYRLDVVNTSVNTF